MNGKVIKGAFGGMMGKKRTARQEARDVRDQLAVYADQLRRLSGKTGQDMDLFNRRSVEVWEFLWGTVNVLTDRVNQQNEINEKLVSKINELLEELSDVTAEVHDGEVDLEIDVDRVDVALLAPVTDEVVEEGRQRARARMKAEALDAIKDELSPGECVCVRCHFRSGGPNFFKDAANPHVATCPNCRTPNTAWLKDTEVVNVNVEEPKQEQPTQEAEQCSTTSVP